jgi:hypothetical protein
VDAYVRDSGGPRQDASTDQQLTEIEAFCLQHRLVLRHKFADAAKSGGSTVGRDDFNRMVDLAHHPDDCPRGLLLWNYARFARDLDDAILYKALLRKRGVIIHSLTDPVPEGQYGRIVEFFIDISNEEKRRQTSADAKRGLRDLVTTHNCVPGVPPRGFIRQPVTIGSHRDGSPHTASRWRPDPNLVPAVQKAFAMYAAGATVGRIHRELHLYGAVNSYRTFWPNKLYIGILQFGDLTIPDYCDPIISQPIWDACQARLKHYAGHHHVQAGSKDHPRRINSPFVLSGLARCARCGSPLYGHSSKQRSGSVLQSYFCTRAYRNRDCLKRRIPRLTFENAVLDTLTGYILRPDTLQAARQLLLEEQAGSLDDHLRQAKAIGVQLAKLRRQLKNVTAAIAESGHSQALLARLADLETQETALLQRRLELETTAVAPLPPLDLSLLPAAITALRQQSNPQTLRTILNAFIDHVDVQRDDNILTGTIFYYLPPDLKKAIPPPESGGSTVSSSPSPSGPPYYRHSIPYPFTTPCHKKTGSP